ncbi:MAG: hypothetical protein EPO21_05765 [Chloroflexota bacterium]|nr:MAG: hypothetical protein EPO21_05765 [Chloroflexota bacterium]
MPEHVLDTVVLRVMSFSHPDGIAILLDALASKIARFPAEVYNSDEHTMSLEADDEELSELARGLRYAERQARALPLAAAQRYRTWLRNAAQLATHLESGSLVITPLTVDELLLRESLARQYGIGRGESACLVLVERFRAVGVFLSSDEPACDVARTLGFQYLTLPQVIQMWVTRVRPRLAQLDTLVAGMRAAKFGLRPAFVDELRRVVEPERS